MASFTDRLQQFNPYVEQLPVEDMAKVGMYKQKQYDEGIQKIQTNIDNIAGLDVANDVDKAYLQSKLNQLGNNLKFVGAADFSDFQLVNSVSGMANQISKDPNVQNAVSSTAFLRKQQAEMEKAITEGKASQANIYDFNQVASKYLNSNQIGERFNGRYTQYTDVKKKAMEAIKALHPNLKRYDIPFEVDGNGNIDATKIADAMKKYKIEGVNELQIQQAIAASMTPDDLNQLRIDANYQFRGITPEQLAQRAKTDYDTRRESSISALDNLLLQKSITTDPTKLGQIDEQIEYNRGLLGGDGKPGKLDLTFLDNVKNARTNPDQVKYSIYKDGFVDEFANAFKWSSQEEEFVVNPLKQQENWRNEMAFKQQVENRQRYMDNVNIDLKKQEIAQAAQANALKQIELYGDPSAAPWTTVGNETDNKNRASELFNKHVESVDTVIKSNKQSLINGGYTEKEISVMLKRWEDAQGVVSKANIPANAIKAIQAIAKNENYSASLEAYEKKTRADSEKEAGVADILNANVKGRGNVSFTTNSGEKITLSPKELVGVLNAERKQTVATEQVTTEQTYIDPTAVLNSNQRKYVDAVYGFGGKLDNRTRADLNKIVTTFRPAANKVRQAYTKADGIYKDKLGAAANTFVPQIKAVTNPKGEVPPVVLQRINQLLVAQQRQGIKGDSKFDFETASSYLADKNVKDTKIFVQQNGDDYEIHIQNLATPGTPQVLKVNGSDVANILGSGYTNSNALASSRMALGGGNTDITRGNVAQQAIMQKQFGNFPGVTKFQITANLKQDLSDPNLYIPTVYVKKKNGKYTAFELSGADRLSRVGYDQGIANLNSLNDDVLLKVLKQEYPKFDFSTLED
jgi:hypothetical protein